MASIFCEYFDWLYNYTEIEQFSAYSYKSLMDILNCKKFVSLVPHDENRIADGIALREEFVSDTGMNFSDFDESDGFDDLLGNDSCSVLEMIIALAKRMDFEVYDPNEPQVHIGFFVERMISNLGLDVYDDDSGTDYEDIDEILTTFINRTYDYDGYGGLFPLRDPDEDQRKVEIWAQMMQYMREEGMV